MWCVAISTLNIGKLWQSRTFLQSKKGSEEVNRVINSSNIVATMICDVVMIRQILRAGACGIKAGIGQMTKEMVKGVACVGN